MAQTLESVLLLALPASGKSEVRKFLASLTPAECEREFHLGATVQLDDFPYVHLMRRIDDELVALGQGRLFFNSPEHPFRDARDWGTLIHLLNEDHADLQGKRAARPASAAEHLFARLDAAAALADIPLRLAPLDAGVRRALAAQLEAEARKQLDEKHAGVPDTLQGKTLVIEFARGGPQGSKMPIAGAHGYRYSLSRLSDDILKKSAILYVWVTPEESRRKNQARADPNDPGSILHHGVPIEVMLNDYGCDDMDYLEQQSSQPGTVTVEAHGKTYHLPIARFDNRVDKTSFIRADRAAWKPEDVRAVREGLKQALDQLAQRGVRK